ncbi:hypothetical protein GCM10010211_20540 [Streptomyces albospinus]|uniref:Uncharacterized protein n=1 Tax=Streptomyces albospinus TaxID=285515 RepID=A0ABQ2UV87_9ACTN|nr:hypothetical protein [Streptomyces albospinus]GGU55659.1 hypothetical protein GCM10010211_20540 [Streptomyces albospinus]
MTKRGSNDRKAKARKVAREQGVRMTVAHSRLLEAKNRDTARPADTDGKRMQPEDPHELRIHRFLVEGTVEVLDGYAASHTLGYDSTGRLRAGCRCGWVNPHKGPRFPDSPSPYGVEAPEQKHWRWYHLTAWSQHAADAEGEPPSAQVVQDPDISINDLTRQVIFDLRLLLDHAQDDADTVASVYGATETLLRAERVRIARERTPFLEPSGREAVEAPGVDLHGLPDNLAVGLRVLLRRTHSGRTGGHWELRAIELAAGELRRLVLLTAHRTSAST